MYRKLTPFALAVLVWSCGETTTPPVPTPTSVRLSTTTVTLDAIGATAQLTATVLDQDDQAMAGQSVTWATGNAGVASVSGTGLVSGVDNGQTQVTATSGSLSAQASVTVTQAATQLAIVAGDGQTGTVGALLPNAIEVEIRDRMNNVVPGGTGGLPANTTVNFAVTSGGGSVTDASVTVDAAGKASTTWTLGTVAGLNGASATLGGGGAMVLFSVTGIAGAPDTAAKVSGDLQTGAVATQLPDSLVVRLADEFGNPVVGDTVYFSVTQGGGSVSAAAPTTESNGRAAVAWTLGNSPGPNEVSYTVTGLGSGTFTATATFGPPSVITASQGQGQDATVGVAVTTPPEVHVTDAGGNDLSGVEVTFAVTAGGGSATGDTATTDANGLAAVGSWTLGTTSGVNQLTANVATPAPPPGTSSLVADIAVVFTATALVGPAVDVAIDGGDNQTAVTSTAVAVAPSVLVTDNFGNPVENESIAFTVTSGGGVVGGSPALTDAAGIATAGSWTLGASPGANTLKAVLAGVDSVTFTATAVSAVPDSVAANDGDNQIGLLGAAVNTRPSVKAFDAAGNPFVGAEVVFSVTGGGGSVTGATDTTDAAGIAQVGSWTLGALAGANMLTATVTGSGITDNPVTFNATADTSKFNIDLRYVGTPPASQKAAFDSAAAKWSRLIIGDVADLTITTSAGFCAAGTPALNNEPVDDVIIWVVLDSIDGPSGILGQAGPCSIRVAGNLTVVGGMTFDTADLSSFGSQLEDIAVHEMGHVLGFGTLWPIFGFLENPSLPSSPGVDTHFDGPIAIAEFDSIGGTSYTGGAKVPVENTQGGAGTRDGHWRETIFDTELMTGFLDAGTNPMSSLSVASMWDLGYLVNLDGADSYSQVFSLRAGPSFEIHLKDDIRRGPILVVDSNGRVIDVIQN